MSNQPTEDAGQDGIVVDRFGVAIVLEINGRGVHDVTFPSRELRPNQTLRLEYPPRRRPTPGPVLKGSG
ncbi:hypothetical protein MLP_09070 [Microlunatus phosphovorus NM-1]|uniref:Uncharacterized protein n=1 Tax=Microlunatus phosphovorus (strain ATCC 700054 / DSM 10555 / JCM 9379 / NBRC 101784 / NCIMB 13414 / VKM Ac-1990 / NM-1) TaxID=1032480 RepID=F5XM42_MICPN|nr:hypothetical protein [Microlunatus phosphovorus]BAK33921.1 hypothetical protein MLP_09070 [Microlunatus phosphovorus NM-1]